MQADQVRAKLKNEGVNVKDWAIERGFKPTAVYHILNGCNKGRRGNAHRIAVALGIKPAAT